MRVASARPSRNAMGGWIHRLSDTAPLPQIPKGEPARPVIDADGMMRRWFAATTQADYQHLAELLGVSAESLRCLKCAWAPEHRAWAFPMRNGAGIVVGIRLRDESGHKWSVKGGHEGVFVPSCVPDHTAYIVEGPTNLAALLSLGKFGLGRPSCSGGISHLAATCARLSIQRAVILADNDDDKFNAGTHFNPGIDGARRLAADLGVACCIALTPAKDIRKSVQLGMTGPVLDSMVNKLVWMTP